MQLKVGCLSFVPVRDWAIYPTIATGRPCLYTQSTAFTEAVTDLRQFILKFILIFPFMLN